MTREKILHFIVPYAGTRVELVIELREAGRYFMSLGNGEIRVEIEMTPGLLQELRRTMGKIA